MSDLCGAVVSRSTLFLKVSGFNSTRAMGRFLLSFFLPSKVRKPVRDMRDAS